MKKHLLFNQLFGTEGSPNQTGETLTRENRIGLMSYLRRTLMFLFAVLVMSMANIGMAWGTSPFIIGTPSSSINQKDGVYIMGKVSSAKIGNTSANAFTNQYEPLYIFSESTNITGISFDLASSSGGSSGTNTNNIDFYISTNGYSFTKLNADNSSLFSASSTNPNNELTSLCSITANKDAVATATNISATFTNNVKVIKIEFQGSGNHSRFRNISVTYEPTTQPTTYFQAHVSPSTNNTAIFDEQPTGASMTVSTTTSSGSITIDTKKYLKDEGSANRINLGAGHTFQVGDQIVLDIAAGSNTTTGYTLATTPSTTTLSIKTSSGGPVKLCYTVQTNDGIAGQQEASLTRIDNNVRIYSYTVLRAAAPACGETAQAALALSSNSGTICGTGTATFTVSGGSGTGALSVSSSDETKATASIDGTTVTVTGVAAGGATITVTKACDATYAEKTATYAATVVAAPTASAGVDKTTEPGEGVALAATAAADGCTGAWTIVSGPNTATSQLSSTSSATATFTPTVAGTYTLRWTVTNTSSSCSAYDDMTVTAAVCSISDCGNATITYPLNVGTSLVNTAANLVNTPSNGGSAALTVPAASAAVTLSTITISAKDGDNDNNGKAAAATNACYPTKPTMSSKIGMYNGSSYSSSNYLQFAFTVNSGYTFTPCDIEFTVQPVSHEASFRWEVTDGTSVYGYGTGNAPVGSGNGATVLTGLGSTAEMEAGTYYIRLYPYYNGSNTFRISNNVILKGTTAAAAPSCSDDTGLAYGETTVNKVYGDASFTNTLTNSNSLSVTYSSTNTNVATVNESTGAVTIAGAGTTTITATWAGNATYCADAVSYTLNVKPSVTVGPTAIAGNYGHRYTIGERIDLTATPGGGSSYTYQWQKFVNSDWENLANGGNISGVTTNRLQISECTTSNVGSYRCNVTAGGQTNANVGYRVRVYTLHGDYHGGVLTDHAITWTGEYTGTVTLDLTAKSTYTFKVTDNDGKWYGSGRDNYIIQPVSMDCGTSASNVNLRLFTTAAGDYTVTVNIKNAQIGNGTDRVNISVAYPSVTHPNEGYVYLAKYDWRPYLHYWYNNSNVLTDAAGDPQLGEDQYTTICGDNYWCIPVIDYYCNFIARNTPINPVNTTGDQHTNDDRPGQRLYNEGGTWKWGNIGKTISFDANGGSGTMDDIEHICSGTDRTLPSNTTITRTGWEFDGWNTEEYGGGDSYDDGATIEDITSDITLYAQWKKTVYMQATGDLNWWYNNDAWFVVWCTNSDESESAWVAMEKAENCSDPAIYKATIPGNGWTKFTFVRKDPADKTVIGWGNKWNHTSKEADPTTNNKFTITGGSGDNCTGTWGSYSAPTFTISYAGGTASESGSKSDETKTCDVAFTLPSSAVFTRTGYTQTGWALTENGSQSHALGGNYTTNADQTFYPVWTADEDCDDPQTVVKTVLTSNTAGTTTGYNDDEFAGDPAINLPETKDASNGYKLGSSGHYFYVKLKSGTFVAGDKIKVEVTTINDAYKVNSVAQTILDLYFYDGSSTHTLLHTITDVTAAGTYTYTLTAADITTLNNNAYIGVYRPSSGRTQNPYIKSIEVEGCREWTIEVDETAPTLESSDPADGDDDVAVSGNITLTFSENVTIVDASKFSLSGGTGTLNTASASASGAVVTIPYSGLANSTTYTLATAAGAVEDEADNASAVLDDISFTTEAAAATYTVTYNAQGGSVTPASETVSTATLPTPTKSGYTFDGWYTSGGSKITGTYNPTADITLYAQWQEICVGSGEKDTIKIGVSSSTSYAASFTSSHKSTHTTASATAFAKGSSTTTSNSTYDKATAPYSVKFKPSSNINTDEWSDNYSVSASFSVASGYTFTPTRISATIVTEAADYTYRALLTDGVTTYTSSDVSSSANGKFTFSFSSLSGTALSGTITFKVQYKSTANNSKYFVFNLPIEIDGIVTASGGGGGASCYYVTYNGNGATGGYTTDEAAYASGDNATAATNSFTKTGYTFSGWATSADGEVVYAAGANILISGNITLFAIWQAAGYDLAWNSNGGSALSGTYSSGILADGVDITAPEDPTLSNYTFNSWNTERDGTGNAYTGTMPAANTTYYAVWAQAVTLDANTDNHGSVAGSATAILGRADLTGITHATPASGYKLTGYYTAETEGTKVLNSDGTFAANNVTDYITSGKWSRTGAAPTLYAQYEASGSLKWNLGVKTDAESLTTSSKESSFTEISTSTMGNATVYGVTYTASSKNNLTGQISTPATEQSGQYVYVTFVVADGYKFTPSSISVKVQPVGENEHKAVKLSLADATNTLVSSSATKCNGTSSGTTTTVTLAGNGTYFTGTVTLKIYVYADATASATKYNCYRLGTPIEIQGEVEAECATMPSFTGLDYIQSSYTVGEDASAISIVGGENINTYAWKQNTTNDRSGGEDADDENGAINTASYTPPTGAAGTMYYWCEMTNTACGIKIKSPAVAITVRADKSDASVTWTGPANDPNYGGGGYVIRATMNSGYDGELSAEDLTAPAGIRITNVSIDNEADQKYIEATFDVTTAFDRDENSKISFTLSHDATTGYDAISDEHDVDYNACSGGGGSSYNIRVRKSYDKDASNNYRWVTPGAGEITYAVGSSISSGKAGTAMATDFDSIMSNDKQYIWVKTFVGNIKQMRLYVETSGANVSVSALYQRTTYAAADAKDVITGYSVVYDEDDDAENTGTKGQHTIDLIFTSALSANDIICVKFSSSKVKALGAAITEGSGGSLDTHLQWSGELANNATVGKYTTDAYFTYSASMITENTNSLGAITYSSSDPSVATVDATGKVALIAAGSTTIKATLAASGCYKKAEISYTLNVTEEECAIAAGTLTLTSGSESKCSDDEVILTLTGFESGASIQWKDGDTDINDGDNYKIVLDGTTSTLTTKQEGTYSVIVTKGCFVRSNRITITNKSTTVHATRLVKEWYIKNGRLTPDIALWELGDDCSFVSVAASDGWGAGTGLTEAELGEKVFYEKDGIVYLRGTEPNANAGVQQDYTLTLTVNDGCDNQTLGAEGKEITIHHQQNTDKHVLAFVVSGEDKGDWTAGVTADQTTNVGLYNAIAANFDVLATNSRSTDDEQKLKEYYSQFDILCITDYPNTGDKGANKKSYVDALGALVDIRPILTMEAFVAKLANWKAKGISGNPKSPSTRQYTMDLQCKDHEIFEGTELTKVGEGDEAMYRVSMVDNTKEEYVSLDATYGGGAHAEKTDYNYGGKPALQGFTFTEDMADDLLPIGLIDDGAGNPLQVGIERQENMEARLMVLGINSYAMERLTDDGERVVINALNYLMKKNAEDIADCSIYFTGGDNEEDEATRYNWNVDSHWSNGTQPLSTQKVRILAPCVIPEGVKPHVAGVLIVPDGPINHGADEAHGSLKIEAGGALIVDGRVEATTAPNYFHPHATTPADLVLKTSASAQAALILDNDEGETQATVNYYSLGRKANDEYQFQYFASPMGYLEINPAFAGAGIYTYAWDETIQDGWERRGYYTDVFGFEGLAITTKIVEDYHYYTLKGALASTADIDIPLTYTDAGAEGQNLIGNSWTAPINIASLVDVFEDDANVEEKTVSIYNSGNENNAQATAGTWTSVPIALSGWEVWTGLKVIPSMQAFRIDVTGETQLSLNYQTMVRQTPSDKLNEPLKAPSRRSNANGASLMRLRMESGMAYSDLFLVEGDRFSEAFDNGYEAKYIAGEENTVQFYAMGVKGKMAVLATDELEGTVVGFEPGKETAYTISFNGEGKGYYLNDVKMQKSTLISEENTYSFDYEAGDDANRFYISATPFEAPNIATGMSNLDAAAPKVQKIIYNDKLYIIRGGKVFSADGQVVK